MEPESPISIDSDTIVVDSGIDLADSISSATSTASGSVKFDNPRTSTPVRLPSDDQPSRKISTNEIPNTRRSLQSSLPGDSQRLEYVSIPALLVPRSRYIGWKHSLPVSDERSALSRVLESVAESGDRSLLFHNILLEDFVIYRPGSQTHYPWQVVTLDNIISNREGCKYLVDGVLSSDGSAEYVEGMEIDVDTISIDGFEDTDVHSVQKMIYLKTQVCARRRHRALECWYRLGKPSKQYEDLHEKFLWVADLTKHTIDYLDWKYHSDTDTSMVHLQDFQHEFLERLDEWHDKDMDFQKWRTWYGKMDFRVPINRHREFIFSRAYNLGRHYLKHDLWSELMARPAQLPPPSSEDTVVTPYIQHCCKSMTWSYVLEASPMSESVVQARQLQADNVGFSSETIHFSEADMAGDVPDTALALEKAVESRSIINVSADEALDSFAIVRLKQTKRKQQGYLYSYVYIQGILKLHHKTQVKVIFLYLPSETICRDGYYPRGRELFFSDDCNCSASGEPILLTDIICPVNVTFGAYTGKKDAFFTRQKYIHAENAICTLRESDFRCPCRRPRLETGQARSNSHKTSLQGLSLFAGCGNFDLGLEAAGAIEFVTAIDISECGLQTYAANRSQGPNGLILDSVNPCLAQILRGSLDLPSIGQIQCIVAGCPCQGFSLANANRQSIKAHRNCSLFASTLSYIETYLPEYALIENVDAMGTGARNGGNQGVACLVGMGYQVRRLEWNSCDCGSAQNRNRLFILAAAPNLPLPAAPKPSSSKVTASAVSEGLPEIDNDDLICVPYPDHIPGAKQTPMLRELIRRVNRYPKGMNFVQSAAAGSQGEKQVEFLHRRGFAKVKYHRAFTRIDPDGLVPTITTAPRPADGRGGGKIIHWDQHRTLTLLEARRAQGFPDDEVIVGSLPQQWYQVGNAVNRQVAMALGEVIADSWFSTSSAARPQVIVDIPVPERFTEGNQDKKRALLPSLEDDDSVAHNFTGGRTRLLAEWIHGETEALVEDHNRMEGAITDGSDFKADDDSFISRDTISVVADKTNIRQEEIKAGSIMAIDEDSQRTRRHPVVQAGDFFATKKIFNDESEFLNDIFRAAAHETDPRPTSDDDDDDDADVEHPAHDPISQGLLRFKQIQRREMFITMERNPAGEKQPPVRMITERSLEVRTETPSAPPPIPPSWSSSSSSAAAAAAAAAAGIVYGSSAKHPIEITETEVSVSKKRRRGEWPADEDEEEEEEEDADDLVKKWVGKRVNVGRRRRAPDILG